MKLGIMGKFILKMRKKQFTILGDLMRKVGMENIPRTGVLKARETRGMELVSLSEYMAE